MSKRQAFLPTLAPFSRLLAAALVCLLFLIGCGTRTITQTPRQTTEDAPGLSITVSPTIPLVNTAQPNEQELTPTPDCLLDGGTVEDMAFSSEILTADFSYKIYLPPCYDSNPGQHYPVLYLLHGLSYDNQQWLRLGLKSEMDALIQSGEVSPFIVVLPLEARFAPPESSLFGDAVMQELLTHVDSNFRTLDEKAYRAIGGLSRGAAWAVRLGFEHYDRFSKVGGHSLPLFKSDVNRVQTWLTKIPKEDLPLVYLDIGRNDPDWQTALTFANQLDQNAIPHEWYLFNGGHSESYWSAHLSQYLRWYAGDW
ncbi:MAG: alpha/beta hydrolase-fold protein [Brevefilum sp.]|nr:alpha/beta hydrolase-fold protein [Brevefilum sp.]